MNELNPYQSPETSSAPPRSQPRPSIRLHTIGGVVVGFVLAIGFASLSLAIDPPVLFEDAVEVYAWAVVDGTFVGLIVGLFWGVVRVMRAKTPS